jgi:opacity protein-like surface antigen
MARHSLSNDASEPAKENDMRTSNLVLASLVTLTLVFAAAPPASAAQGSFELALGGGLKTLDDKLGGDAGWGLDFRVGYFVTDRFAIELQSAYASTILEGSFAAHTLNAVYHFEIEGDFVPYVLVGAGTADVQVDALFTAPTEEDDTAFRAAVGGRFEIGQQGRAFTRAEISLLNEGTFDRDSSHFAFSVLWGWNFAN